MSDTLDEAPSQPRPTPPVPAGRAGAWRGLRPLVMRLHFYVGMFVGPFILLAALTGLIYTITPQLDQLLYRDALTVPAAPTSLDLQAQVAAASAAVPDGTVTEVRPAPDPDVDDPGVLRRPGVAEDYARTAFVDPHTGQVRAVLDTFGEWLPTRAWIDTLHRNLHLGDVGRVYTELAASWLWVLAVSGLALWVVRRRRRSAAAPDLLPRAVGAGSGPHPLVARVGRAVGRGRHAVPLRHRPDLVAVRGGERLRAADRAVTGRPPRSTD